MIGSLKERLTIINPERLPNGRGGWSVSYDSPPADSMTVWAAYERIRAYEQLRFMQFDEEVNGRFIIRDLPFLRKDSRLSCNGKHYIVQQIAPAEKKGYTQIAVREA